MIRFCNKGEKCQQQDVLSERRFNKNKYSNREWSKWNNLVGVTQQNLMLDLVQLTN